MLQKRKAEWISSFFNEKWHNGGIGANTLSFGLEVHELCPISATILSEASYLTSARPFVIPLVWHGNMLDVLHLPVQTYFPSLSILLCASGGDIYGMGQSKILTFWHSVNGKHQQEGNYRSLMFMLLVFLCQVEDWRMVIFLSGLLLLQLQVLLGVLTIPIINTFRSSSVKTWILSLSLVDFS